jgi:hypothetical protein
MPTVTLSFDFDIEQTGAAIGDTVYYISNSNLPLSGNFNISSSLDNIVEIGEITAFNTVVIGSSYTVEVDCSNSITLPLDNDYVFYSKNNAVSKSSLIGYYAETKFVNNSTDYAEMFRTGLRAVESSK